MSYKFNSSNCSLIDDSSEYSVFAKLRRLKIEENLLVNSINKIIPKETNEDNAELPMIYSSECKNYSAKLKNSVTEIKNMFGDIRAAIEEKLNSLDIESMKRDVIKMDAKIRTFKDHIQSELSSAISKETELMKQINDVKERPQKPIFKPKTRIKQFKHMVPSPVKVMIQSPFKCKEVQQFQEFMKSSPNRYGGWNEFHHNAFVQIWHKHFNTNQLIDFNNAPVCSHDQFQAFEKETMQKISGSTNDDIVSHHNWYCKYLYLKEQQQHALNQWKGKKRMSPKPQYKKLLDTMGTSNAEDIANDLCDMTLDEGLSLDTAINKSIGNDRTSEGGVKRKERSFYDILKPTKQWANRCGSSRDAVTGYNNLETIIKLRIPDWRLPLQD